MANWLNLRLEVSGPLSAVRKFRRSAGRPPSAVFPEDLAVGEGGDFGADPIQPFGSVFKTAPYRFQGCNDDYVEHFAAVSRSFPDLAFVLVYSDPNGDSHGSYLVLNGRRRRWELPVRVKKEILKRKYKRAGVVDDRGRVDYDADEADFAEWEAFWEMMDVAEAHWRQDVRAFLKKTDRATTRNRPSRR